MKLKTVVYMLGCIYIFFFMNGYAIQPTLAQTKDENRNQEQTENVYNRAYYKEEYATPWVKTETGVEVHAVYVIWFKNIDYIKNEYDVQIGCYYEAKGEITLYSDRFYVNDSYVGTFSKNNGYHSGGTIYREVTFDVRLKCGITNVLEFKNVEGVGGEGRTTVYIGNYGRPPKVDSKDGVWKEGEVAKGIRTWQSLYTDGATGDAQRNKIQTATGFMYYDMDEQPTPVNAYHESVIGNNSSITKITNASGREVSFQDLNNKGTYQVFTQTIDSGGMIGTGSRYIRVLDDKAPSIQAKDQTIYEGQYSETYWKNTQRWKNVSAHDEEDGDLTKKIVVLEDDVNVHKQGVYKVIYQVSDSNNHTVKKEIKVQVLFNNPPVIQAEDRWFSVDEDVTNDILLEDVYASDVEDGSLSHKVKIIKNTVKSGEVGDYEVTYRVQDAHGKSVDKKVNVYIVEDVKEAKKGKLRFINKEYLDTLRPTSIWRQPMYYEQLYSSLHKEHGTIQLHLRKEDILAIQKFNQAYDYSKSSTQEFLKRFQHLWKAGEK